jgi:DNA helicase-2/ATP-dependent DNA helicase PcrA
MPCDKKNFSGTEQMRCRMYVALSRATTSLAIVVSPTSPSPLFDV